MSHVLAKCDVFLRQAGARAGGRAGGRGEGQKSRQILLLGRAFESLVRRFNHMRYLGGPESLPHSFINSVGPDLGQNCLQWLSVDAKSCR